MSHFDLVTRLRRAEEEEESDGDRAGRQLHQLEEDSFSLVDR